MSMCICVRLYLYVHLVACTRGEHVYVCVFGDSEHSGRIFVDYCIQPETTLSLPWKSLASANQRGQRNRE